MADEKDRKGLNESEEKKQLNSERKSDYVMKVDQDGIRESVVEYAYKMDDDFEPVASTDFNMKQQGEYTVEDYYALSEDKRMELIDGVLYEMLSPTYIHQKMIIEIGAEIRNFIRKKGGLCQVFMAPFDVKLNEDNRTMVEPDIFIVCDPKKVKYWGIDGAPDFVIEIVSPSSKRRDYILKVNKYIEAGVKEYWIIDPMKERILVYQSGDDTLPYMGPLSGRLAVGLYEGELEIDLDEIQKEIEKSKLL